MSIDVLKVIDEKKNSIRNHKEKLDNIKASKIKYESQLEQLTENEQNLIQEIKDNGYDPNNLSEIIDNKINELNKIEEKINNILNS